jgi:hypothetical protein
VPVTVRRTRPTFLKIRWQGKQDRRDFMGAIPSHSLATVYSGFHSGTAIDLIQGT